MKRILKYLLVVTSIVIVAVAGLLIYVKAALPNVGAAEEVVIEYTPEMIERGKYLANHVMVCMDCHSTRDWSRFSGPLVEGTLGKGGERFDQSVGMPGVIISKNITPAGITRYTDGELFRVITTGVTKEGKPLFPLMPYPYYGRASREDIYAVIAYIRSLEPIENNVQESELDFPLNFIVHAMPQKAELGKMPPPEDQLAYGTYLANISGCVECHTRVESGQILPEFSFSGGREFGFPDGSVVRSSNITPHQTGIGNWDEKMFVQRFKAYSDSTYTPTTVGPGEFNSIMPWTMYAGMTDDDLKAIFAYLKTVQPIENTVERFTPGGK